MRTKRRNLTRRQYIYGTLAALCFVAILGVVGGMEWGTIELLPGFLSGMGLSALTGWALGRGGFYRDS